jgi:hypothetical protein
MKQQPAISAGNSPCSRTKIRQIRGTLFVRFFHYLRPVYLPM